MLIGLIILIFLVAAAGLLLQKNIDHMVGGGMGLKNKEEWGMDEQDKEYHE